MADVKIRFPYPDSTDPTHQLLVTMVDQGDGTFAPKISGNAATAAGGAPSDATYITKTANATLTAETAIGAGTAGQILQSDGTNPVYTDKSVTEAQVATTDVTTGDATTTKHGFLKKLGASAKILQSDGTVQQWVTEPAADLVAAAGDMLIGTAVDTLGRVAIGTSGKVWQSDGTTAAWQTPAAGFSNPMTGVGDIIQGGTAGAAELLAAPLAGKVLQGAGVTTRVAYKYPPGYEVDYVENTSTVNPTATSEATANTVVTSSAVVYDGSTIIRIEFYAAYVATGTGAITLVLYDGSSSIGILGGSSPSSTVPMLLSRRLTPSNASHTYSIRAYVDAGTGHIYSGVGGVGVALPTYIRITKVSGGA